MEHIGERVTSSGGVPARALGFWSIWALGVGAVVGDGIFVLIRDGIQKAGPASAGAFLLAGLFQMFLMIALGELAVGMPFAFSPVPTRHFLSLPIAPLLQTPESPRAETVFLQPQLSN